MAVQVRICFVKFADAGTVGPAQHLNNTVFIDRALIVAPYLGCEDFFSVLFALSFVDFIFFFFIVADIPDEVKGLELLNLGNVQGGLSEPKLPPTVISQVMFRSFCLICSLIGNVVLICRWKASPRTKSSAQLILAWRCTTCHLTHLSPLRQTVAGWRRSAGRWSQPT